MWKTSQHANKRIERLESRCQRLEDDVRDLGKQAADSLHTARTLDLEMTDLADKVKRFTGRLAARQKRDGKTEEPVEDPKDLNEEIRQGRLTHWP